MPTTPGEEPELAPRDAPESDPRGPRWNGAFAVVRTVLDPSSLQILRATHDREWSALGLSQHLGIPIVACYRRLKELEELGIIAPSGSIARTAGHPIRLFRSCLRSARISFEDGRLTATIELARPGSQAPTEARFEEALDRNPVRRKRSRSARDLGDRGSSLELVPHGEEGALDSGEAGRQVRERADPHVADAEDLAL